MTQLTKQQQKALNYNRHISLTANAGSGKTFVFSERYLKIATETNTPFSRIAAITFTDKAAAELRIKIERALLKKIDEANHINREKLFRLRRQLVSAKISTIHSFCIEVLREFAAHAEIDAGFIPIDQRLADELIELSMDDYFSAASEDETKNELIKTCTRLLGSKQSLISEIRDLLKKRELFSRIEEMYEGNTSEIVEENKKQYNSLVEKLFAKKIEDSAAAINSVNTLVHENDPGNKICNEVELELDNLNKIAGIDKRLSQTALLVDLITTSQGTVKKRGYTSKIETEPSQEIAIIEDFAELWKHIKYDDSSNEVWETEVELGRKFVEIVQQINDSYSRRKNNNSYVDFEDILLHTKNVLSHEEVRTALAESYDYIMIDEYQDTNQLQYEIFMPILEGLSRGNLFVVGDEKQSIYRFRNAEIQVYNKTKEDILGSHSNGELLDLPHTFRLSPQLTLFSNKIFENIFADPNQYFNEVIHNEMICSSNEEDDGEIGFLIADEEFEISESELIARRIIELVRDGNSILDEIAVLCRTRKQFKDIEEVFIQNEIPYTIVGGKGFYQQQLIYDIYNYLSFLINDENDSALVGILRSPFYFISDAELYNLSKHQGETILDKLKISSKQDSSGKYSEIISLLEKHRTHAASASISDLLSQILIDTNYYAITSSRKDSKQHLANINKLFNIAIDFSLKNFNSLFDFVQYLKESMNNIEDEGHAPPELEQKAVQLMTIHQSKGLEFNTVFIHGTNNARFKRTIKEKSIEVDKEFGILTKVPLHNYFEKFKTPPKAGLYNYVNDQREFAEFKRLLYVAITRARKRLFISASVKNNKPSSNSFLDLILNGLNRGMAAEEIEISGTITRMKTVEETAQEFDEEISFSIPVIRELPQNKLSNNNIIVTDSLPHKIDLQEIKDSEKHEFVSATKVAVYNQCPVKYKLIYETGFGKLQNILKRNVFNFEFSENELAVDHDPSAKFADIKGSVVHELLERNISDQNLFSSALDLVTNKYGLTGTNAKDLAGDISSLIKNYYKSVVYKEINSKPLSKNEFEIYSKLEDIFLYGIVDKLIIEDNTLTIIDYKTDKIDADGLNEKSEHYKIQLKFYAFVLSRLYPQKQIKAKLIFLYLQGASVDFEFTISEIHKFGTWMVGGIHNIRQSKYVPNLNHCKNCFFFENNSCVYPLESKL